MKIIDEHKKTATVKGLISVWEKGGINAVIAYLNTHYIIESEDIQTWVGKIKKLIEEKKYISVNEEIELVSINLNLKNKIKNGKKEVKSTTNRH